MFQPKPALVLVLALASLLAACKPAEQAVKPAAVDAARLTAADTDTANWMSYGRTYSEQRFSPLKQVNDANIGQLGLAWSVDLDAEHRAQEATPLIIDGVMYVTTAWSKLFAFDAASGKQLWAYDPKVPGQAAVHACCDAVNRGAAAWDG
jgi:glucose dehydrogenase